MGKDRILNKNKTKYKQKQKHKHKQTNAVNPPQYNSNIFDRKRWGMGQNAEFTWGWF